MKSTELPNIIPPYNGIGANEYIVDITHEGPSPDGKLVPAIDFTSTVDTHYRSELNMWYHTMNCGFRQRISGERRGLTGRSARSTIPSPNCRSGPIATG